MSPFLLTVELTYVPFRTNVTVRGIVLAVREIEMMRGGIVGGSHRQNSIRPTSYHSDY